MELNPHQIYERYKEASEDYLKTKVRSQIPPLFSYALLSLIRGISSVDCGCGAQKFLPMPFFFVRNLHVHSLFMHLLDRMRSTLLVLFDNLFSSGKLC